MWKMWNRRIVASSNDGWSEGDEELRRITAHHEAGHAVATYVSGGTVHAISIAPDAEYLGQTLASPSSATGAAFAIHAGPWAEARSRWKLSSFDLDDPYQGKLFEDMVFHAWTLNAHGNGAPSDGDFWVMATDREEVEGVVVVDHEYRRHQWNRELENYWEATKEVATLLLRGDTIGQHEVSAIVERLNPGARRLI